MQGFYVKLCHKDAVVSCGVGTERARTCSRWYCSSAVSFVQLVARMGLLRMLGRMVSILLLCLAYSTVDRPVLLLHACWAPS